MCGLLVEVFWKKKFLKKIYGFRQNPNFYQKHTDFEQGCTGLHLATYLELKPQHLRIF